MPTVPDVAALLSLTLPDPLLTLGAGPLTRSGYPQPHPWVTLQPPNRRMLLDRLTSYSSEEQERKG